MVHAEGGLGNRQMSSGSPEVIALAKSPTFVELNLAAAYNPVNLRIGPGHPVQGLWQGFEVTQESQVILYTHPDCAFSAAAKMDYRKRKIAYEDVDLSKQEDRIPEVLALTNGERVTPVIVENGTVTIGYKGGT